MSWLCVLSLAAALVRHEVDSSGKVLADLKKQWVCGEIGTVDEVRRLGAGQEGTTFEVRDSSDARYVLKVPHGAGPKAARRERDAARMHQRHLEEECAIAETLEARGVERAMHCVAACSQPSDESEPASRLFTPVIGGAKEFGMLPIDLGEHNGMAVAQTVDTMWGMLLAGVVNVDQANNVLYAPDGAATFIDFGRAIDVRALDGDALAIEKFKKGLPRFAKRMPAQFAAQQVKTMVADLLATVPESNRGAVAEQLSDLAAARPLPVFGRGALAVDVAAVVDGALPDWAEA